MIQVIFFLKFRSQLSRTRPELIADLEERFTRAAQAAGGRVSTSRRALMASFGEDTIGRWLDMTILPEELMKELQKASGELYGACLLFCREMLDWQGEKLCRALAGRAGEALIWCDDFCYDALASYGDFGEANPEGYRRLLKWKNFEETPLGLCFPYRERILKILKQGNGKSTLLLGAEFMGKRDGIYHYCAELSVSPLIVRFGSGGRGLVCFADAYSPGIEAFFARGAYQTTEKETLNELAALREILFRERLRDELSSHTVKTGRRFMTLLLSTYMVRTKSRCSGAVLIMENILEADDTAAAVFADVYAALPNKKDLLILGTSRLPQAKGDIPKKWASFFPRILKFTSEEAPAMTKIKDLPQDLLEIAYTVTLLGRYVPAFFFPLAFKESGLSPAMLDRAFKLFLALGIIDTPDDPRIRVSNFISKVEGILGERKERSRTLALGRILAWVAEGRLKPCFNLLRILAELGGRGSDELILKAVYSDAVNGTWEGMEEAMENGQFDSLTGTENSAALRFIFKTQSALVFGNQQEIASAFRETNPPAASFSGCKARIAANLTAWYLGIKDIPSASQSVKETLLLNQRLRDGSVPAYRLYALTNLASSRISDAIEYISFAVEEAEKQEQLDELVKSLYFGAGVFFLHGNISKAQRMVKKAEEISLETGSAEWADRCRFLKGRFLFELGRCGEALEIFESLSRKEGAGPDKAGVLKAWIFRAKTFLGQKIPSQEFPGNLDMLLFRLEASYLGGHYVQTAALAEKIQALLEEDAGERDFLFTEQIDWRSGFEQCECMLMSCKTLGMRLVTVYTALARCKLGASRDIASGLQRFMREDLQDGTDPNDAFYYYACYLILKETGAAQVDMNTAVSMAFKRLQRRASRIDDIEARRSFLNNHYWNQALGVAAKEYKLI